MIQIQQTTTVSLCLSIVSGDTNGDTNNIMNPTRSQKALETKLAKSAAYDAQTITADRHWKIHRVDERNWELRFKGDFKGFFGDLPSALRSLPSKMLSEEASGTIADVLRCHRAIVVKIEEAFKEVPKIGV